MRPIRNTGCSAPDARTLPHPRATTPPTKLRRAAPPLRRNTAPPQPPTQLRRDRARPNRHGACVLPAARTTAATRWPARTARPRRAGATPASTRRHRPPTSWCTCRPQHLPRGVLLTLPPSYLPRLGYFPRLAVRTLDGSSFWSAVLTGRFGALCVRRRLQEQGAARGQRPVLGLRQVQRWAERIRRPRQQLHGRHLLLLLPAAREPLGPGGPCNSTVGRQDLYDHFGPGNTPRTAALMASAGPPDHHSWCASAHSSVADCYRAHSVQKLTKQNPGYWYSSLAKGYCGDADSAGDCTWRVVAVEKVCRTPVGNAAAPALQNSRTAPAFPTPAWISSAACC